MESAKISFFRVDRCGYYRHGESAADFGHLGDVFSQLRDWSAGVELVDTKLAEAGERADQQPVYLAGIHNDRNSFVLATWNEVPSHEAGVASISLSSKVGRPKVSLNALPPNSIPGYATYFWVIPSRNLVATIRFGRPVSGQTAMVGYINRFLQQYTAYAIWDKKGTPDSTVVGFTDKGDGVPLKVRPKFRTSAFVKPGLREKIVQDRLSIAKVIRRGHLSTTKQTDRAIFQRFVQFLRSEGPTSSAVHQSAYLELEYTPDERELQAMITAEDADLDAFGWDDLGFTFKGEAGKIYWLGRSSAVGDFTLPVERLDEETISLPSLLNALNDNRAQILKLLE